jgi:hypothetical protein
LTISLEENLLDIKGKPMHVRSIDGGKYHIGVKFIDLDENATNLLQKYISVDGTEK